MSEDSAMQNFTMNTLRGMGTGGSTASSNSTQFALLPDRDLISELPQKMMSHIGICGWPDKFFQSMQGVAQSLSIQNVMDQLQPPTTPIGGGQKLPNIMGRK